ncbi:Syntaxin-43 [Triticum urartu]|uniref:Syntaxin-43 n=1 Tax=Triticum urartu TaxID=4572 RepID=M8ABM9_TRIUA|nr:Syntaxin-43 [Triticum urartu]
MVGLPPAWVDVSEEISANMQRAKTKMAELAKAHAKALMPSFGDGRDDQRAIEILTHEITDLLKRSEKKLQKLSMKDSSEDSNVRKNVQRSLATDLQTLSMEFRKKQSTYLKQLRQQKEGQDGVDLEMNMNGSKSTFELEDDEFEDVGFTEVQMSKLKKSEAFTREREREIEQVAQSVNELAQIMKDLSVLVIDQGTIVDRIDYNVQNVAASVEEGYKQLQKAERTQKKGGMVMCATVLVILIFILIILLGSVDTVHTCLPVVEQPGVGTPMLSGHHSSSSDDLGDCRRGFVCPAWAGAGRWEPRSPKPWMMDLSGPPLTTPPAPSINQCRRQEANAKAGYGPGEVKAREGSGSGSLVQIGLCCTTTSIPSCLLVQLLLLLLALMDAFKAACGWIISCSVDSTSYDDLIMFVLCS